MIPRVDACSYARKSAGETSLNSKRRRGEDVDASNLWGGKRVIWSWSGDLGIRNGVLRSSWGIAFCKERGVDWETGLIWMSHLRDLQQTKPSPKRKTKKGRMKKVLIGIHLRNLINIPLNHLFNSKSFRWHIFFSSFSNITRHKKIVKFGRQMAKDEVNNNRLRGYSGKPRPT